MADPKNNNTKINSGSTNSKECSCLSKVKCFNEYAATIILFLCIASLLFAFLTYVGTSSKTIMQHEYTYTIKVNSSGTVTPASQVQIDSIKESIKSQEHLIKDHYDYLLEQREKSENILTTGGIFISIILSIFAFFGYKSFKSIEEEAMAQAKKIAQNTSEDIATTKAKNVSERLGEELENKLKKDQAEYFKTIKEKDLLDAVQKAVDGKYIKTTDSIINTATTNTEKNEDFELPNDKLKKKDIEGIAPRESYQPPKQDRTTTSGMSSTEINNLLADDMPETTKENDND